MSRAASEKKEVTCDPSLKNETVTTFCQDDMGYSHPVLLLAKSAPAILESCLLMDNSTIPIVQTSFRAQNCRTVEIKIKTDIFKKTNLV